MKEGGAGHPGAKALVVLAAGMSSRYGRLKQLEPVGPGGEALLDYAVFDAVQAGFRRVVFVIRPEIEEPFRAHVAPLLDAGADLRFAYQSLDDLPAGRSPSDGRAKPWGTAHAVWAARHQVEGPFAVCNADDFYGADGYKKLADFLDEGGECGLVGYRLANTLSPHGGVSRGLVQSDPQGSVTGVVEALDLRLNQVTGTVEGRTDDGESVNVDPGSLVSMNLWGFRVEVFTHLERLFEEFLSSDPGPRDEFYISKAVGDLVDAGVLGCRVLATDASWLGVTYAEDRERVAQALASPLDYSSYPLPLAGAWESLF